MHSQKVKSKVYVNFLLLVVIFGLFYFIIYPKYTGTGTFFSPKENISKLLKEKKDYEAALSLAVDYNTKIIKANTQYTNALDILPIDTLNKVLPSSADPILIIYELLKIAARPESNMLLSSPRHNDDGNKPGKNYNILSINFSLEGTYEQMKAFLKNLEASERIYNVTSLEFSSSQDARASSAFKYTVTVETYYLKQN